MTHQWSYRIFIARKSISSQRTTAMFSPSYSMGGHCARRCLQRLWKIGLRIISWLKPRMFRTFPNHIDPWILSLEIIDYFGTSKYNWVAGKKRTILISKPALVGCCKLSLYPIACRINRLLISRSNLQASETECCCKSVLVCRKQEKASSNIPGIKLSSTRPHLGTNYEECIKCLKIKKNESIQIGMKTSIAKFTECEMLRHDKIYRRIEPDSRGSWMGQ